LRLHLQITLGGDQADARACGLAARLDRPGQYANGLADMRA
jgi:hypothetical protein